MKARKLSILALLYASGIVLGTALFIVLFRMSVLDAFDYLFYKALLMLVLSCAAVAGTLLFLKLRTRLGEAFTYRDIIILVMGLFFLNYSFYGAIPFNVSRSTSVILLGYLDNSRDIPRTEGEITDYTTERYFRRYRAVSVRLDEQIVSGNVKKTDGGYVITEQGKRVAALWRRVSDVYKVKNNFLDK